VSSDDALDRLVFGTDDPRRIDELLNDWCATVLGAPVASTTFTTASVGVVSGLELVDGRRVVVKAFQPRWTRVFLTAVARVQAHVVKAGFPCPAPIGGPAPVGTGFALAESELPDPGHEPMRPDSLVAAAGGLARLVELCRDVDPSGLSPHPLDGRHDGGLYPQPHNPVFDFAATAAGAEWIDELAAAATEVRQRDESSPVIAHTDWSVRNIRLRDGALLAVYDWDALAIVSEAVAVGQASVSWAARGEVGDVIAPSLGDASRFVRSYEQARGRSLDDEVRGALGASALWMLAYTARCEHALDPLGGPLHRWARDRLAAEGAAFLELGDRLDEGQ
jgi:hypothetical protein